MTAYRRWDFAWAGLDPSVGHEQAGHRPVLVLSHDVISRTIGLVAVVPLTSWKKERRVYPTEVLLPPEATSLSSPSLALCHQVRTVSAKRLSSAKARLDEWECSFGQDSFPRGESVFRSPLR